MTAAERKSDFKLTTDTPSLALEGKLWGVYCENLGENWMNYSVHGKHESLNQILTTLFLTLIEYQKRVANAIFGLTAPIISLISWIILICIGMVFVVWWEIAIDIHISCCMAVFINIVWTIKIWYIRHCFSSYEYRPVSLNHSPIKCYFQHRTALTKVKPRGGTLQSANNDICVICCVIYGAQNLFGVNWQR